MSGSSPSSAPATPRHSGACVTRETLAIAVIAAPVTTSVLLALVPRALVPRVALVCALPSGALAIVLATGALSDPGHPFASKWIAVAAAGGLIVGITGIVGLASILISPAYLATAHRDRHERNYFIVFYAFWAVVLAVPLVGNL